MTWVTHPAKGPGLRATQVPPVIRLDKRPGSTVLDLTGIPIDPTTPGPAHLATLPAWAHPPVDLTATILDDPNSVHPQMISIRGGQVWWIGQWRDGRLIVNRPASLHGGLTYPTKEQS